MLSVSCDEWEGTSDPRRKKATTRPSRQNSHHIKMSRSQSGTPNQLETPWNCNFGSRSALSLSSAEKLRLAASYSLHGEEVPSWLSASVGGENLLSSEHSSPLDRGEGGSFMSFASSGHTSISLGQRVDGVLGKNRESGESLTERLPNFVKNCFMPKI